MTATALISYSTLAIMNADHTQPGNTFGQVTADNLDYRNNGTYQYDSVHTTWNPVNTLNFNLDETVFRPQDFGAAGTGLVNDTTAFIAVINAALSMAVVPGSPFTADVCRGSVVIEIPPGLYLVDPGVFSTYTIPTPATQRRTLVFRGSGWYNTSIILNGTGALYYDDSSLMMFAVFEDIGFYGDTYLDVIATGSMSAPVGPAVTLPVTGTLVPPRVAFHSYGNASENQGWKFLRCLFCRFGAVFILEGMNNDGDITFDACKALNIGTWLMVANAYSQDINHYGCMIEGFTGNLVFVPPVLPNTGGAYTASGGLIAFYSGTIVMLYPPAFATYLIDIQNGASPVLMPQVTLSDTKIELHYDYNGLCNLVPLNHQWVMFRNVSVLTADSAGGAKSMCSLGAYNRFTMERCTFYEIPGTGTSVQSWTMQGVAPSGVRGDLGRLEFIECLGAPTYDLVDFNTSGSAVAFGYATNVRPQVTDYGASSEIQVAEAWTATYDPTYPSYNGSKFSGFSKSPPELHRCALLLRYAPVNALYTTTVQLPLNAVIDRIMCNIPPQGTATATITYTLTIGGTQVYTATVTQQKSGLYFNIKPSDFTPGGPGLSVITSTSQPVVFSASGGTGGSSAMEGFGIIEYW